MKPSQPVASPRIQSIQDSLALLPAAGPPRADLLLLLLHA
jgi:hypothetical protein